MKKLFYSIIVILLSFSIGCESLDEVPYDFTSDSKLYQNEADIDAALVGVYQPLILGGVDDLWYFLILSGASEHIRINDPYRGGAQSRLAGTAFIDTDPHGGIWSNYFNGINRANIVIEKVSLAGLAPALEEAKIAEARFLRAFYYFHLVRMFGGVPLNLTSTKDFSEGSIKKPRSSAEEVYSAIIEDLTFAEARLPEEISSNQFGRATSGTAKALLGQVYLTMAGKPLQQTDKYSLAAQKLAEVIGKYTSEDKFSNVFSLTNEQNNEIIFARPNITNFNGAGTVLTYFGAAPSSPFALWLGGGQFQFGFTENFYNSYEPNDERRDVTMLYTYVDRNGASVTYNDLDNPKTYLDLPVPKFPETGIPFGKLKDPEANNPFGHGSDLIFLRYADVLLMLAEALNEDGESAEALQYINAVRQRAGLGDLATTDQTTLRKLVKQERKWELAGEFVEYYDIQRWGDLQEVMQLDEESQFLGASYNSKYELLPIPINEIQNNRNLDQNPGY